MELDRTDFEILAALQKNARLSNKELAGIVDLAPSTTLGRVRRLEAGHVLTGYHAAVWPHAVGIGLQAMVSVRLGSHSTQVFDEFEAYALGLDELVSLYNMAGRDDFHIHLAVRNGDHLRLVVLDGISTRPEVANVETNLIFAHFPRHRLPLYDP